MNHQHAVKIDWMTLSGKAQMRDFEAGTLNQVSTIRFARAELEALTFETCELEMVKNNGFYPYCYQDILSGAFVQISDKPDHQGYLIIFPGTVCFSATRRMEILSNAAARGLRCTRLDVAVDLMNYGMNVKTVAINYESTEHERRKVKTQFIQSPTGDTFYIGSRASAHYLRVYDKAAQQGVDEDWIRVEIELKQHAAPHWMQVVSEDPKFAIAEMRRMLDIPGSPIDGALEDIAANYEHDKAKVPYAAPDDEVWFRKQVVPAFRRIASENPKLAQRIYETFRTYFEDGAPSMEILLKTFETE